MDKLTILEYKGYKAIVTLSPKDNRLLGKICMPENPSTPKDSWGFAGDNIEEAESLRNFYVKVERDALPELEENSYYIVDLLECEVETVEGELLGKMDDIFNTGSNDVYVVKSEEGKQILLPAIKAVLPLMSEFSTIICEHPTDIELPDEIGGFTVSRNYRYGKIAVTVYKSRKAVAE